VAYTHAGPQLVVGLRDEEPPAIGVDGSHRRQIADRDARLWPAGTASGGYPIDVATEVGLARGGFGANGGRRWSFWTVLANASLT